VLYIFYIYNINRIFLYIYKRFLYFVYIPELFCAELIEAYAFTDLSEITRKFPYL